jgi:hypothetical protein
VMDRQIDRVAIIRFLSFLRMMFAGTNQRDPQVGLQFRLHRDPPAPGALHRYRRTAFLTQPCMQIVQTWHGGCKPTGFDLRFFVRRTHCHGCCQPSLADIDSRASFCNYRDRDHRSSFLRQTRAGGSKQYFASRARSTISGSIFAGRTGLTTGVFPPQRLSATASPGAA